MSIYCVQMNTICLLLKILEGCHDEKNRWLEGRRKYIKMIMIIDGYEFLFYSGVECAQF